MAEGRQRDEWSRCSEQLALLANCFRAPDAKEITGRECNPFYIKRIKKEKNQKPQFKMSLLQFARVLGVDISPEKLERAKKIEKQLELQRKKQ